VRSRWSWNVGHLLAFAVGVYLQLSSTLPIFVGGLIRCLADRDLRRQHAGQSLTEDELNAIGDRSPGVLLSSGYIAGGAIAGILIAFMQGVLIKASAWIEEIATNNNPFYSLKAFDEGRLFDALGRRLHEWGLFTPLLPDLLSLIPFLALMIFLLLVAREKLLAGRVRG
jgi:hypothetical protein